MSNPWSAELIAETRIAIHDGFIAPDGYLHFKNCQRGHGKIALHNLLAEKWLMEDRESDAETRYATVDELIEAGWAVDQAG
jgi:hypothetical protein